MSMRRDVLCAVMLLCAGPVSAGLTPVPLGSVANGNVRTYTAGTNYPSAPSTLVVAGVPFELTPLAGSPNSLGVAQTSTTQLQFSIPVSVFGATTVYTLINSAWGQLGVQNGRVECIGTGGVTATFPLVQGTNIRDHWTAYNQVVNDPTVVPTTFGGGARLDRQTFVLPASFLTQTLTEVRLIAVNPGNPQGAPFLAGLTVDNTPPCDSVDFNNDGLFPDTADIEDFLTVFAGGTCSNDPNCHDVDFNNDGLFPDTRDIEALLSVFSGGPCLF